MVGRKGGYGFGRVGGGDRIAICGVGREIELRGGLS